MLAVLQKCTSALVVNSTNFTVQEFREVVIYHGVMDLPDIEMSMKCYKQLEGKYLSFLP